MRDAYFVVRALNRLATVRKMENYFGWLMNVVSSATQDHIQPVYRVGLESNLAEKTVPSLPGYRGMSPVRVGNEAYRHDQHDSYGNVVLGVAQAFLDRRLMSPPARMDFLRLEEVGRKALAVYDKPDAGMWELRSRARVHTASALLACRNHLGMMSEDVDIATGEAWGNYPQTYSMVGIINCAMRLSRSWEKTI